MTTRAMKLTPNGGNLKSGDMIQEHNSELIVKGDSVRNNMTVEFAEQEKTTIPNLERDYENGKITFEEYDREIDKLNMTITYLQAHIKDVDIAIDQQYRRIDNISIEASTQNKKVQESLDIIEKDNKINLKETLNARRTVVDN